MLSGIVDEGDVLLYFVHVNNKCSGFYKILNTSCTAKRLRQTVQLLIRLLLQKQSDQGLPCLLF